MNGTTLRVDGGSSLANVKANVFFDQTARLNVYDGDMSEAFDRELSPELRKMKQEYKKRSKL